jgi:hypothetical protein
MFCNSQYGTEESTEPDKDNKRVHEPAGVKKSKFDDESAGTARHYQEQL